MPLDTSKPAMQQIGNYDLLAKIAEGGMGTVYKGRNRLTGQIVAIKIVPPTTAKQPILLQRFEREFRAASALDHPNIVKALEYNGVGASPFLVMEYVDGESLGQRIERDGAIPEGEAVAIIAQVCQGLYKAHKMALIHRDVKPDNVLVTSDGIAKLTDLGLVKDIEGELNLTRTGRGLGTPHFMAPEQFRNAKHADVRCDIYSLGATLYMMVTGEIPFGKVGPLDCWMKKIRNEYIPPRELMPSLSERVDWAIRRSMSGDPEKRPANCREFVEDLHGSSMRAASIHSDALPAVDIWYLVYKDELGETHTVKGTTEGIRRALKEGLLGDASNIRACRTKMGPFQTLESYPEFRDLVIAPAPLPPVPTPVPTPAPTPVSRLYSTPTPGGGGWRAVLTPTPGRPEPDDIDLAPFNAAMAGFPVAPDRSPPPSRSSGAYARPSISPAPLTPVASPTPPDEETDTGVTSRPHFPIKKKRGFGPKIAGVEWWVWLVVMAIAVATGLAAFVWLPKLNF
jgi:serine/threonine protein kinase